MAVHFLLLKFLCSHRRQTVDLRKPSAFHRLAAVATL